MSNIDKQALCVPERKKNNWCQAVMRDCDFCQQWALTVRHSDGGCICASCCDSEYTTALSSVLVVALDELEAKDKRLNEILAPNMLLPAIDDMDEDNLRHVIKTVCENYSLLHAKWEAAEKRIAELSQKADIYDMLRQDYELQGSLVDFVDWQAKRIADLESREVKLPELKMLRDYLAEVTHREREDILVGIRLELFRAIEEAGVKVATACKGEAS